MTTVALDCETGGKDNHHHCCLFFVTTCDEEEQQRWWEWPVDPLTRTPFIPEEEAEQIKEVIASADVLVGQNIKYDAGVLKIALDIDWPWEKTECTLTAGHLLASNQRHDLTALAMDYLGIDIKPFEDALEDAVKACRRLVQQQRLRAGRGGAKGPLVGWRIAEEGLAEMPSARNAAGKKAAEGSGTWRADYWLPRAMAEELGHPMPDDECEHEWITATGPSKGRCIHCHGHCWWTVLRDYSNADSAATIKVWQAMEEQLRRRGLWAIYRERMRVIPICSQMELRGITYSRPHACELAERYEADIEAAKERCLSIASSRNCELELPKGGTNGSLSRFVFDVLRLPPIKHGEKSGAPSLDKETLAHWIATLDGEEQEFVRSLSTIREKGTALTYLAGYERYAMPVEAEEEGWCILHPWVNPTGSDTLRFSFSNPNCFDGETEYLTRRGWVKVPDFTSQDEVAQYWPDTCRIDFVSPESIIETCYEGPMIHITTDQQVDLLVTPNHRCLLRDRKTGRPRVVPAHSFRGDYRHLHAGLYEGGDVGFSPDEVTWLCATQADGTYSRVDGKDYGISFVFKKQRKIDRLRGALKRLGADYSEKPYDDGRVGFYVKGDDRLVRLARNLMPKKCFGAWILDCDRQTLDMLCSEIFLWDGSGGSRYSSSVKDNTDWVQALWALSGGRTRQVSKMPNSAWAKREHHYLSVVRGRDYSLTTNYDSKEVQCSGKVYCLTVPSGFVVVRRNGKVSVSGNSANIKKGEVQDGASLRYCFGPMPGREWWSVDAKNIELRIPAYESEEAELIALFERPDDPPYYGSQHLLNFHTVYPDVWDKEHREVGEEKVGPHCKKKHAVTWYQWCKNGDFAIQYGCGEAKADATFRRKGAYRALKQRFAKLEALNQKYIRQAKQMGYVETIPDRRVDPTKGYPLAIGRGGYGDVKPTLPLNYHVQSTAMWWTQMAMINCEAQLAEWRRKGFDGWIALQVHDELVFDLPAGGDPRNDLCPIRKDGMKLFRTTNLWRVRRLQEIMAQGGERIGVPTPTGAEWHSKTWGEGVTL